MYAFVETCIPSIFIQQLLQAWHFPKGLGYGSGVNKTLPEGTGSLASLLFVIKFYGTHHILSRCISSYSVPVT